MRGAKNGTQRVSTDRNRTSSIVRVAIAAAILIAFDAATPTASPVVSSASYVTPAAHVTADSPDLNQIDSSAVQGPTVSGVPAQNSVSGSTTYQESSARIAYRGRWSGATFAGYLGRRAMSTRQSGASATFTFTGTAVSWIGPTGPTRGNAKVYVDGRYVKTVSTYSSRYSARRVLFSRTWATARQRTLKIVVVGTAGHPTVALDAISVSGAGSAAAPTSKPAPKPGPKPSPTPPPAPAPAPIAPPASAGKVVNVSSIPALKSALADDTIDQIVVANGTYHVSPAGNDASDSLWIGGKYANRTRPVIVKAASRGGVTFDGGGGSEYGGLAFEDGAHHQTWDGFNFANMTARQGGIIVFGGYLPRRPPHHVTIRNISILGTCRGTATTASGNSTEHAIYFAHAAGVGPHDLLAEDISVDGSGFLASAIHGDHGDATNPPAYNVTIRRLHVVKTQQAIILWQPAFHNWTVDTADISGALAYAVRYESIGGTGITFANITSTGSGIKGFYSTLGLTPPGVTFINDSFH